MTQYDYTLLILNIFIVVIFITICKKILFKKINKNTIFILMFILVTLIVLYIIVSYKALKYEIYTIYHNGDAKYDCGVFINHLSNGVGGRGGIVEKSNQLYKLSKDEVKGHCFFSEYQACQVEKSLTQGEKVCVTYTKSKYKKECHIYKIENK